MAAFSFNIVTMALTEANGGVTGIINMEGTAEGFGFGALTMTVQPVAAPTGTFSWVYANFPEQGDQVTALGSGEWEKVAWDRWNTTFTVAVSNGVNAKGEAVFDLTARTWAGAFEL